MHLLFYRVHQHCIFYDRLPQHYSQTDAWDVKDIFKVFALHEN